MKRFSEILFRNKAIIDYRKISIIWISVIFLLTVFFISIPFFVGRYTQSFDDLTRPFPNYSENFVELIHQMDCEIKDQVLNCVQENQVIQLKDYKAYILVDDGMIDMNHAIIFDRTTFTLSLDNDSGISGSYQLGDVSFKEISQLILSEELDGERWANVFLRSVDLSRLSQDMVIIYLGMVIQYAFYIGIIGILMLFINAKQSSIIFKLKEIIAILVLTMVSPALLMAFLSLFSATIASVLFPVILITRIVIVYMAMVRTQSR